MMWMEWNKEWERILLLSRLNDEDLVCVAAAAGLAGYDELCKKARQGYVYLPDDVRSRVIKDLMEIEDEKLVEAFRKTEPRLYPDLPFRGNYYTYLGDGDLQLKSSWSEVKRDVHELLEKGGERMYAFLKAVVELTEELLEKHGPRYCYIFGPDYGSIVRRMREILGRLETPLPRDFVLLKASGIYYKSGSRRYPSHSILLETLPAVKEALEEWERSSRAFR
ncbi:MAG: hypothetical protein LM590_11795 [Thermofilum sp.]|nr:hypothetical protein [Thermofilum sp.]